MVGITPWEIRYRNAIEPGKVLPNGQIADVSTALKETLRGFRMILDGECDEIPESCFLFVGTIDEVFEKAKSAAQ